MESLNSNSQERELHQLQQMLDNAKENCMKSFWLLHSFLQVLSYDESKSKRVSERAFMTLFGQDNETFTSTMFLYVDQLQNQIDKDEFHEDKIYGYILGAQQSVSKMQSKESKVVSSKALDASLVVTECSGTKSDEHITSSSSGTYITYVMIAIGTEKPNTPRSCLRWIPTGRIFKLAGLRWIPTRKMFIIDTTKVDSEPPNGSNEDITNPYECDQTLNVSADTLNLSAGLVPQPPSPTPNVPPTKNDWDTLFCLMFDEYFNPSLSVAQPVLVAAVQEPVVSTGTPSSTRIDQDTPSTSTSQTIKEAQSHVIPTSVEKDDHGIEVAHMDNDL
ncbi:hypothetical protein Tco_0752876 [Tanacetum coccineum]